MSLKVGKVHACIIWRISLVRKIPSLQFRQLQDLKVISKAK